MHNINMLDSTRSKNQFPYRFLSRIKRVCEEKPRRWSFWQNASLIRFLCSWRRRQEEVAISKEPAVTVLLKRTRWEGESNIFSRAAYERTSVLNSSRHFIKRLISSAWNHIGCCEDASFFSSLWKPWGCNSNAPDWARFGCKNKALKQDSMRFYLKKINKKKFKARTFTRSRTFTLSGLTEVALWW